jgi:hypothetical protein
LIKSEPLCDEDRKPLRHVHAEWVRIVKSINNKTLDYPPQRRANWQSGSLAD